MAKAKGYTEYKDIPDDEKTTSDVQNIESILDTEVVVVSFLKEKSEFGRGEYVVMSVEVDDELQLISTGAKNVVTNLISLEKHLPIKLIFTKIGRKIIIKG